MAAARRAETPRVDLSSDNDMRSFPMGSAAYSGLRSAPGAADGRANKPGPHHSTCAAVRLDRLSFRCGKFLDRQSRAGRTEPHLTGVRRGSRRMVVRRGRYPLLRRDHVRGRQDERRRKLAPSYIEAHHRRPARRGSGDLRLLEPGAPPSHPRTGCGGGRVAGLCSSRPLCKPLTHRG